MGAGASNDTGGGAAQSAPSTESAAFTNFKKAARFTALFGSKEQQKQQQQRQNGGAATAMFRNATSTNHGHGRGGFLFSQRQQSSPASSPASRSKFPFMPKSYNASPRNSIVPEVNTQLTVVGSQIAQSYLSIYQPV